eukprot:g7941.t1
METGWAELCAASAKAQATSEALERSHKKLNPELDQAQRLELLERFSASLFCCPDYATEGFCSVGRARALECLRDLAIQLFPQQPAALLAMPLQAIARAVPRALPHHGTERWLRQYRELCTVLRFVGDNPRLPGGRAPGRHISVESGANVPAGHLSRPAAVAAGATAAGHGRRLALGGGAVVAKLYSCSEECLRSAAVLGQAASLQELYLSKACSPDDLWTGAQLRPSLGSPGSHALHVLCLSITAHSAWAGVDSLFLRAGAATPAPVLRAGRTACTKCYRAWTTRPASPARRAGTRRRDSRGRLVTSVLLRQLLFQLVPDVTALLNATVMKRFGVPAPNCFSGMTMPWLDEYRRLAAAAHALGASSVSSLQTLAAAARVYARPVLERQAPDGEGTSKRLLQTPDWEETSGRLLQRSLEQRQLLVRALCVLGIFCCEARRGREQQRFKQLWVNVIRAYDRVQLRWIALAGERSSSRHTLEDTCESDYQTLLRLCETAQPLPPAKELLPQASGAPCEPGHSVFSYREWLHNHAQLEQSAEGLVERARQNYARLSRFALTQCGWVLPAASVPPEPPGQSVDDYVRWLCQAGLVELINQELQEILSRA